MEIQTRTNYSGCIFEYKTGRITPGTLKDTEKTFIRLLRIDYQYIKQLKPGRITPGSYLCIHLNLGLWVYI